jgi:hypothetical protein
MPRMSPLTKRLLLLGALLGWCGCLVLGRVVHSSSLSFLRWNSWDALSSPLQLLVDIADRVFDPLSHPQTIGVTIVYGMGLFLGYAAFRGSAAPPRLGGEG